MINTSPSYRKQIVYAGFFTRILAALIDCSCFFFLLTPLTAFTGKLIYRGVIHPTIFLSKIFPELSKKSIPTTQILYEYFIGSGVIYRLILDQFVQFSILGIIVLFFWLKKQASPGKLIMKIKIVDEKTLKPLSSSRLIIRLLSYVVSALPLGLGFIMIGLNRHKKGFHDNIAGSIVIKS